VAADYPWGGAGICFSAEDIFQFQRVHLMGDFGEDFGLAEVLAILIAAGIGIYLLMKVFKSANCGVAGCANSITGGATLTNALGGSASCGEITCPQQIKAIQKNVGCVTAANEGIADENALNACGVPNDVQMLINKMFGTSFGVTPVTNAGLITAPASASGYPACNGGNGLYNTAVRCVLTACRASCCYVCGGA
jgi:hypothetical protein